MRDIIHRHNRLNGITFSIIEFGLIALFVGAFGIYYRTCLASGCSCSHIWRVGAKNAMRSHMCPRD